jgi:hypothetical protein
MHVDHASVLDARDGEPRDMLVGHRRFDDVVERGRAGSDARAAREHRTQQDGCIRRLR